MTTQRPEGTINFTPIDDLSGPGEARSNVELLSRLFPDAVVDGRVDLDVLRDLLGDDAEPAGTETSGLRWPGMAEARQLSTHPATGTLLPRPDESVDWDTTKNIAIEGDNLEVLRLLRRGYTNKVDVIYIDPPYNIDANTPYVDDFVDSIVNHELEAGFRDDGGVTQTGVQSARVEARREAASKHAKWLSMMYPRLLVAHSLLAETGVAIVAIDDEEHARLRMLLDRVFGAENFVASVTWQGGRKNRAQFLSPSTDYMLIYVKSVSAHAETRWREPKPGVKSILEAGQKAWEKSGGDASAATKRLREWWASLPQDDPRRASQHYNEVDGYDGRPGVVFFGDNLRKPEPTSTSRYDIYHPFTGKAVNMHPNGWAPAPARMAELLDQGRIKFGPDETTRPTLKTYLDEVSTQTVMPVFYMDRRAASNRLESLMDSDAFAYPKDETVLARWIELVSSSKKDALVLDFFAGSGSTGHAVMNLNAADGGNRRFILVQLDEPLGKDGYSTIADFMRERLRRAGKRVAENLTAESAGIDIGFRSYRLASSNVRPWDGTGELDLLSSIDNLIEGRSTDDLLVEMMLRLGIELTTPVETRQIAGSTLYSLGGGTLYAFFGEGVTTEQSIEVARALVAWRDENPVDSDITLVVRDTGFVDSSAKLNLDAAVKQAGFTTFRSI